MSRNLHIQWEGVPQRSLLLDDNVLPRSVPLRRTRSIWAGLVVLFFFLLYLLNIVGWYHETEVRSYIARLRGEEDPTAQAVKPAGSGEPEKYQRAPLDEKTRKLLTEHLPPHAAGQLPEPPADLDSDR